MPETVELTEKGKAAINGKDNPRIGSQRAATPPGGDITSERIAGIYAIQDILATDLIGVPYILRHPALAIRTFTDVVLMQDSRLRLHPKDYQLVRLGWLHDDASTIEPDFAVIATAEAILASQPKTEEPNK